jgi:hypothetical protein
MAFFSEVKARLGLDIKPFERGMAQAQRSVGGLAKGMGKQFAGTEKAAGALAQALGLNMQSIADGIARFFTGFSKEAEAQLDALVSSTEEAARKQEAALANAQRKSADLAEDIAKKEEERRISRLTRDERINELADEQGRLLDEAYRFEKRGAVTATQYLETKNRLLDVQKELSKLEDEGAKEEAKRAKEIEDQRTELAEAVAEVVEMIQEAQLDAEKKRTNELKKQKEVLEGQRDTVQRTLADYAAAQRKAQLPSRADIRSGDRKIGLGARKKVTELDRSEARLRELQDAEQRKIEEFNNAKSEGDRARFYREGREIYDKKKREESRGDSLRDGLKGRVSDVETNKASLEELQLIKAELKGLNEKLQPTSI